jgi:hypothetical protein
MRTSYGWRRRGWSGSRVETAGGSFRPRFGPRSRRFNPKRPRLHLGCSRYMRTNFAQTRPTKLIHCVTAAQHVLMVYVFQGA